MASKLKLAAPEFAADQGGDRKLSFTLAGTPVTPLPRIAERCHLGRPFQRRPATRLPRWCPPNGPDAEIIRRTGPIEAIDVELSADWLLL